MASTVHCHELKEKVMQVIPFLRRRLERLREFKRDMKALSPLQRRTDKRITACLLLIVLVENASHFAFEHGFQSRIIVSLFTLLLAFPVLATIIILGRYLAKETDEFFRMMVVKALLLGGAFIVTGDTIQSVLQTWGVAWDLDSGGLIYLNITLFLPTVMFSMAIQLRRNR
jgi:hypothetical protein